MLERALNLPL